MLGRNLIPIFKNCRYLCPRNDVKLSAFRYHLTATVTTNIPRARISNLLVPMNNNEIVPPTTAGVTEVAPVAESSQNLTTKFADDTLGYEATLVSNAHDSSFVNELIAPSSQTIIDFLQRPTALTAGSLGTSDAGILWSTDVTSAITSTKYNRMSNIYTFKCDFEFTLQINADRMQQGRYIMFYLPNGGILPASTTQAAQWRAMHTCNTMKITQLPHVEIDLATQTHVTLKIPYTSILPMMSWSTTSLSPMQTMGIIGLYPYSALNPGTGGSTTCGFTVWASMQNIVLGAASVGQMDAGTKEAKAQGVGPVSGVLNRVSNAIGVWGKVPIIGGYASQLAWMTRLAAQSAEFLGYSKPLAVEAPIRVDRKIAPFMAVADKPSYSKPLGMIAENSVAIPNRLTGIDEMSIDFIKKVPAYINQSTWTASYTSGASLFQVSVAPDHRSTWSKGTVFTPAGFLSQQFSLYRGSMNYKFKIVKTGFHRGRICVAFAPGLTTYGGSYSSTEYVFREVVDVSTTSEFSVCCPYLVPQPWTQVGTSIGTLMLWVVDPLVAPNTVSTSVTILLEAVGGDDLQFACPKTWTVDPYCPSTAQMAESYEETPCFTLGPKVSTVSDSINAYTIGEPVRSIRAILKRAYQINGYQPTLGAAASIGHFPYIVPVVTQAATTSGALQKPTVNSDPISLWSCAYALSYGSVRLLVKPVGTVPTSLETSYNFGSGQNSNWFQYGSGYQSFGTKTWSPFSIEGTAEFQSPNWNAFIGRSVTAQLANPVLGMSTDPKYSNCTYFNLGDSGSSATYTVSVCRSAGEDFGLGLFIGVPPVVDWSAS